MYAGYVRIGRSRCRFASKGRDPKKKAMNARGHDHGHGRTNTTRTIRFDPQTDPWRIETIEVEQRESCMLCITRS